MKWPDLGDWIHRWRELSTRRKIVGFGVIFIVLASGAIILINIIGPINLFSGPGREGPYASFGLRIRDEEVYANGSVRFTVYCDFKSYQGYPKPEGELYQISKVFVCTEDDLKEFNTSFGEIQDIEDVIVLTGNVNLAVEEEVSIEFQVSYSLKAGEFTYVGVLADGPTGFRRWDLYTQILAS